MSAKRILDLIALSQAVTAVGRRAILVHRPSKPSQPEIHISRSEELADAEENIKSEVHFRDQARSSAQDELDELSQGRDKPSEINTLKRQQKLTSQKPLAKHDTGNSSIGASPASIVLRGMSKNAETSHFDPLEQSSSRTSDTPQSQSRFQDASSNAETTFSSGQDMETLYSGLFHSPRTTSILTGKTRGPSAWSNIEFRTSSEPSRTGSGPSSSFTTSDIQSKEDNRDTSTSESDITSIGGHLEPVSIAQAAVHQQPEEARSAPIETSKSPRDDLFVNQASSSSPTPQYEMRESKVPSTRLGRIWQYGGLATSLAFGTAGQGIRRAFGRNDHSSRSLLLSDSNMETLVSKLSRMRGAALKLGQMISFQDLKMLPAPIHEVLQRVQDNADFMPAWQRDKVLKDNLGSDWRGIFANFEEKPIAAASIGQVHAATLKASGDSVAVKIQYPGVADSIDSDLNNLALLLTASRLLPKGLYLDKTIANARTELAWECDYIREGAAARHFAELLADDVATFTVPRLIESASGAQVLTLERMHGKAVTKLPSLSQEERDWIATNILRLCLRELFEFRYMQTDPNWTNFLFNQETKKLELLDFGASREYPATFTDPYCRILLSAADGDRQTIADLSVQLGYLTGHESRTMRDAHVDSVLTLAEPFTNSGPDLYDFRDQTITDRVRALIPVMLRERLAPPPEETYSLHRKLSGAFLLCAKLGSRVAAKDLFSSAVHKWKPIET